jgi:RNA polymerase sigma-70 factor (sigma-E family)
MEQSAGPDLSFDEFYLTARDRLVVQIAALTGDPAEAQDHVQEAFARAWVRWPSVSRYQDPEGWVRRVAYHRAVSRWRSARRLLLRAEAAESGVHIDASVRPVLDALARLPARERQVLALRAIAGLSVAEIASELSAPPGTVKSWLSRGRARLAKELGTELEEVGS